MEPVFDSEESSSGCESGWTLYLQHYDDNFSRKKASFSHQYHQEHQHHDDGDGDDDDDDMSMVSDASSGPPHFQEHQEQDDDQDDEYFNINNNNVVFCHHPTLTLGTRKRRKILKQESFQDLPAVSLDDTASSPFFNNNKDIKVCKKEASMEEDVDSFGYSQGHSTTYFEMV